MIDGLRRAIEIVDAEMSSYGNPGLALRKALADEHRRDHEVSAVPRHTFRPRVIMRDGQQVETDLCGFCVGGSAEDPEYCTWARSVHQSVEPDAAHVCDRCYGLIVGYRKEAGGFFGFYAVGEFTPWAQFALRGEEEICDCCMWCDPRYIAAHGHQEHKIRRENRPPTVAEAIAELEAATERCAEDMQTVAEEMRAGGALEEEVAKMTRCEDCAPNRVVLAALKGVDAGKTPWRS